MSKFTRRRFLGSLAGSAAWLIAFLRGWTVPRPARAAPAKSPRVIRVDTSTLSATRPLPGRALLKRIGVGMVRLTGEKDQKKAWRSLFSSVDRVGIKVSALAGAALSPRPELVACLVRGLRSAGVKKGRIVIWERSSRELQKAGYELRNGRGVQCRGTDEVGYEPQPSAWGEVGSCFSRILTSCTAHISVAVLKDHDLAGVSLCMKNFYGGIHNPNKYHDNACDPFVADLNRHPYLYGKVRLSVIDAVRGQYHGGPAHKPQYTWDANRILLGTDPVAVDRVGMSMIEEKRNAAGHRSLAAEGRHPAYIFTAGDKRHRIGESDLARIRIIEV